MKLLRILFILLLALPSFATNWYVDNAASGDNDGTTWTHAWESFADITWGGGGVLAGDTIYLSGGAVSKIYREQLTIGLTGSIGNLITITDGASSPSPSGHDGDVKIYGSTEVATWGPEGGDIWSATSADPLAVWFVETDESVNWGDEDLTPESEYDWYWDTNELFVFAASDPDTRYTSVEIPTRDHCVYSTGKDYITVSNLEMCFAIKYGVAIYSADNFVVDNDTIHHIGVKNSSQADGIIHNNSTNCTASNNVVDNAGTHGIFIYTEGGGTSTGSLIEGNEVSDCYYTGIDHICANGTSSGHIIRRNKVFWTPDYDASDGAVGIHCNGVSGSPVDDVDVNCNQVMDIPGSGIQLGQYTTNWNVYNNTICRRLSGSSAQNYGIFINGSGISGHDLKNNISVDGTTGCLYVNNSNMISACDYNLWYNTVTVNNYVIVAAGDSGTWGVGDYVAYNGTTGWDTNGLWASPVFVDKANNNFHLQAGSPCRNVGADVSLSLDYDGIVIPQETNPAIGAFEYLIGAVLRIREILRIRNVLRIK